MGWELTSLAASFPSWGRWPWWSSLGLGLTPKAETDRWPSVRIVNQVRSPRRSLLLGAQRRRWMQPTGREGWAVWLAAMAARTYPRHRLSWASACALSHFLPIICKRKRKNECEGEWIKRLKWTGCDRYDFLWQLHLTEGCRGRTRLLLVSIERLHYSRFVSEVESDAIRRLYHQR